MTASAFPLSIPGMSSPQPGSYRHAHWYFLAAFGIIVAGFWPSFFQRLGGGDTWHTVHGVSASLWVVTLAVQSFLMSRGLVRWHRRTAVFAILLLAVLVVSAVYMIAVMQSNTRMPPFLPPLLGFIDLASVVFLVVLVGLALANRRRPAVHKRFMAATVLLAFPPALTRLYFRTLAPHLSFMTALHASFLTAELILVILIVRDWRSKQRHAPYPVALAFFAVVQVLMSPVSTNGSWLAFLAWFAQLAPLKG